MEPQKTLPPSHLDFSPQPSDNAKDLFRRAVRFARAYYSDVINRIESTRLEDVSPDMFFTEYLWVVHATGFSSHAVTKFMPRLAAAWGPVSMINPDLGKCLPPVLAVCNNPMKAKAVHQTAMRVQNALTGPGWEEWRKDNLANPDQLVRLPYIGRTTCMHLARNLGNLDVVKPDLHLVRMAKRFDYQDSMEMIKAMSSQEGTALGISDLCLWYYLSTFGSITFREEGDR